MAWSSAFIAALASGRYAPRYRLVCLADLFGRVSRGELGSEPGTVADADLVIDRVAPVLSGDGLDLPTAKAMFVIADFRGDRVHVDLCWLSAYIWCGDCLVRLPCAMSGGSGALASWGKFHTVPEGAKKR